MCNNPRLLVLLALPLLLLASSGSAAHLSTTAAAINIAQVHAAANTAACQAMSAHLTLKNVAASISQGQQVTARAAGCVSKNGGRNSANGAGNVFHNQRGARKKNSHRGSRFLHR